ncbi:MAG: hypothetical protein KF745_04860 [Phycisphaeraceae bacterium]|nr:hypothetical protein [Phycisphaeraceae bacterium]
MIASAALGATSRADVINSAAYGNDLAGARVTVDFQIMTPDGLVPGPSLTTIWVANGPDSGEAYLSDSFRLSLYGHSYHDFWVLDNLAPSMFIKQVLIDLTTSYSLFDNNSSPSSPGSNEGLAGVEYSDGLSTAPAPIAAYEALPWASPTNLGDMFQKEYIVWNDGAFAYGQTFWFRDDTDTTDVLLPAPGSAAVVGGLMLLGARRRRRA